MKILDRYLGRAVLSGTLLALLALSALEVFVAFLGEVQDVGRGDYTTWEALVYVLLTTPRRAYMLFPYAVLLGALFSLGAMAVHSELVVIRSLGVSITRFLGSVLKTGVLLVALAVLVGEGLAPAAEQYAQTRRAMAQSEKLVFRGAQGLWVRDGLSFINIRDMFPGGRLGGIYIYEFDKDRRLKAATHAKGAVFVNDAWQLEGMRQSRFGPEGVETRAAERVAWESFLAPELLNVVVIKPENLSLFGLYRYIGYLKSNGLDASRYRQAFWAKLAAPVVPLVMLVVAVPFVFGPLRSAGAGQRLMLGALLGIVFHIANQTFGQLGQIYAFNPLVSALFPSLLVLGGASFVLYRMR